MSSHPARPQFPDEEVPRPAGAEGFPDPADASWASWFRTLVEQANDLIYLHDAEGRILYANSRLEQVTGWRRREILGRNILELLAPEFRASAVARRQGLVETTDGRRYETEVICRDGSRLPVEVHSTPVWLDDGRVVWQGIARDIRERRQAQARMDAVYETARQVVGILNLEQVLSLIVHHATQITRAQSCSLWLLDESQETLTCAAQRGAPEGIAHTRIPATSDHPVARAFRARGATVVDVGAGVADEPALPPGTRTCVWLPLGEGESPLGVLSLTYPWAGVPPAELSLLSIFASHAAAAIANARLFEAQHRKTQEAVAIGQVGMAVASLDRDAALHIAGAYTYDLFQADLAAILVVDDRDRAYLRPAFIAERGRKVEPEDFAERFPIAQHPALLEAVRAERPLVIEDVATHPLTRDDARALRVAVTSGLVVPMLSRDQVEGVLLIGYVERTPLSEVRIRLAETLAQQAAVAVDNAAMIRALATAKQEWETTFDAITDPVCLFSPEGVLLRANQAAGRLLAPGSCAPGKGVAAILDRHYRDLFFGGQDPGGANVFEECLATGRPVTREVDTLSIPGVYQVSVFPLRDGDGGRAGFVAYIKDVTTQHEMQARLYHSARLAGVGELAAGVVHNFKNVLMGVSGMLDLASLVLEAGGSLEEVQQRIEDAQEHVFRGNQVLQRLLDFARGIPREVTDVPLDSLLPDVVALCRAHPAAEGMRVRTEVPPGLPPVRADAGQLHEVLVNLVLNAFQAMTPGGTVTISAEASGEWVRIRVADTGCGIPDEELERIFEPFYSKRQHGPPGSGIGLSASLRTVNAMGGNIQVRSEVGIGTVFTVQLPCASGG